MPRKDLLHIVQLGQALVGDHLIDVDRTDGGRLTYTISHIQGHELATASGVYDTFEDALMHALGHMADVLRAYAGGDDSTEGPAADHEIATNLLELLSQARGLHPQDFTPKSTTLQELRDALSTMLNDGVTPNTPIRMRTHSREPNLIADPPAAPLEDIWHNQDEQIIYLDEPGI